MAETNSRLTEEYRDLHFDLLRNAHYNDDRARFFVVTDNLIKMASLLSGTAVVARLLANAPDGAVALAALIAALQTASLVFGVVGRAVYHGERKSRYYALLSELQEAPQSLEGLRALRAKLTREHEKEPAIYWAADAMAWNNTYCATRQSIRREDLIPVSPLEYVTRHIIRYTAQRFRSREPTSLVRSQTAAK